jgi:peptide/nickel transport system permease protein
MHIAAAALRRAAEFALLGLLLTAATFLLCAAIPGDFFSMHRLEPGVSADVVDRLRERHGLDLPVYQQYARWLRNLLHLDLGHSLFYQTEVSAVLAGALANTLWIGLPALIAGAIGGILLGTIHGARPPGALRRALDLLFTSALSLPPILLGLTALLFAAHTQWFPLGGMTSLRPDATGGPAWDRLHHLCLPVACLAIPILTWIERIQCASVRDSSNGPALRAARTRGLSPWRLFFHYRMRPALNPVLSTFGPLLGSALSGSLIVEMIFAWPGLGQITYEALFNRDPHLLVGCVLAGGALLMSGNLIADGLLAALDPRTRTGRNRLKWQPEALK